MSAVRTASSLGVIAAIKVRDATSVLKSVSEGKVRSAAGALSRFFGAMTASAAPASRKGFGNSSSAVDITTATTSAGASGGTAPYTYSWARTDGGGATWNITNAASATTAFEAESVSAGATETATFVCTITDAGGEEAETNEVTATAINLGGGL